MSGIMSMLLGAVSSAAAAVDEFFNRVTLLLPGNGTNGAQNNTFLDSSSNNFTITRNGNTTQGTFSPFSQTGWSNFFDGAGDYLTGNGVLVTTTTANTFSCEGWFYPTTFANVIWLVGDMDVTGGTNNVAVDISTGGAVELYWWDGAAKRCTSTSVMSLNQWNYFAVVVNSGAISIYVNSTTAGQSGTTTLTNRSAASQNFSVGQYNNSSTPNGYISNLRWSTSARTISSIPTAPYTSDANTRLLICQSNRFVDNSSNGFTLTPSGTPSVQAFSPFAPTAAYSAATVGGSGYFDGTGDYLVTPSSSNLSLASNTSDFCFECWVYNNGFSGSQFGRGIFIYYPSGSYASTRLMLRLSSSSNKINLYLLQSGFAQFGGSGTDSTGVCTPSAWTHVAFIRNSNTFYLYLNGVLDTTLTASFQPQDLAFSTYNVIEVGRTQDGTTPDFNGYISGFRFVRNSAVYTAAFTPPTAPPTAITNTSLLLNFTNAGIVDATAKNDLETVGNAQISTTQSKFGGSSMSFDGNGDYLKSNVGTSDLYAFGTGDFTIEMWVYVNSLPGTDMVLYDGRPSNGAYPCIILQGSTNKLLWYVNTNIQITSTNTVSTGTWFHLAIARSGTSTKMFVNGTQSGSTYTDSTNYLGSATRPYIGANATNGAESLNGYIDDLRVTKGVARYTANFTAPTSAFPLQ